MTEFEAKADIDQEDTEVFVRIPHGCWRRIIAGFMASVTFFLGLFGVPSKIIHLFPNKQQPTEVQK